VERTTTAPSLRDDGSVARGTEKTLSVLQSADIVARIFRRDHTVWLDDPREIADRLGWLDVADGMRAELPAIREFAAALPAEGVEDVVLLGMGGSSLAPEVFRRTFGRAPGCPRLHVLDTTSPSWIRRVTASIRPDRFHALVASKSGSTIEVQALLAHFEAFAAGAPGGSRFTAITDPGTGLEAQAREKRFRRVFLAPPTVGGRYSALSFFGLVPAAVLGVDVAALLERAIAMEAACAPAVPIAANPAARLGALLGSAAEAGRDKLGLLLSPGIESFGLWVEQLVAESTGKDGKGIVPIVDEPAFPAARCGGDRVFVATRLAGDDNATLDARCAELAAAGQPVLTIEVPDRAALGAEMFRWELATAIAGHLLGVHPFDQPDVQATKARTTEILDALSRGAPAVEPDAGDAAALVARVREGDFVGIMVYGDPDAGIDEAVRELRLALATSRRVATTYGVGPRFLHSTGQLHKGGSPRCAFLQLVLPERTLPIPGLPFGFGELLAAQASADLLALRAAGRRAARVAPAELGELAEVAAR
jgi:glucose-6-phosphate isomerase/transaldolase/glucose-6-phosphate isomerase